MKNSNKNKEELIKELNNLHKKQNSVVDLYQKDLEDYNAEKLILNTDYQKAEIQRLISEHQVILLELELIIQELTLQNEEKENRTKELAIVNTQLSFQNKEKRKRADELTKANFVLAFENEEKAKKAAELVTIYDLLIKKKQRLDVILEVSNSGTWGLNLQTGETIFNERWASIIGYTLEEITPTNMDTRIKHTHPDDISKSNLLLKKYCNGEVDYYECESRMKHKNGQWIWVLDRGKVNEWDKNGKMLMMSGIREDITERKLAEIKLRESEYRYRSLVEWSPESIIVQRKGKIIYVNPAAIRMFKLVSIDDLLGKSIFDWAHLDSQNLIKERIKMLVAIGDSTPSVELKLITQDRSIIYVKSQALVINYDGKIAVQYSLRDITYKKELENSLAKVNEIAHLGAWELNLNNYKLNLSNITKEILEVENNFDIDLDNAISFFNLEKKRNGIVAVLKKGVVTGEKWEKELIIRTAKGNDLWVKIIGETEFLNENPIRINGSFQDINTNKQTQLALQKNLKELEDYKFALDQSAIIAITDEKGVIKTINDNFCKISQYSKEELIGNSHKIITSNYHSEAFFKEIQDTITSGKVWKGVIKNKKKNDEYYWENTTIVPFLDANNKPFQYLSIRYDITEIKNNEDKIK